MAGGVSAVSSKRFARRSALSGIVALVALLVASSLCPGRAAAQQLIGDSTITPAIDTDAAGLAEAFQFSASGSGSITALNVYVDASSRATTLRAGLYTNSGGHPGSLLAQGTVSAPIAGAWNSISISPTSITAGTSYWIAVLGTGGMLAFRDHCCGGGTSAENSAQSNLSSLPSTWSAGARWSDGSASMYGSGSAAPPPPPPPPPSADQVGSWSSLLDWPIVAAHSILMRNNQVLIMDGWVAPNPTYVFDPSTNALTPKTNPFGLDIFCSGHAPLSDGRVIIAGGHGFGSVIGINATSVFDPANNSWKAGPSMNFARWYPSVTRLGDGRLVAISGNITATTWADTPEIYDPVSNAWSQMSGVNTSQVHEEEYPLSFLLPNGKILTIAASAGRSYLLDPIVPSWAAVGGATLYNGSAVMYLPGKILYSGGGTPLNSTSAAQSTAQTLDLTAGNPTWQAAGTMNAARYAHTLTVLPDGKVLAIGGGTTMNQSDVAGGELSAEQWDPTTGQWTKLASMAVPRVYHSTAVLLPDGRVLSAGGGRAEGTTSPAELNAQYYSPPYLFKGARPSITSAPSTASLGSTVSVVTPDAASIASVSLISLAADTHTLDMNQHFVPLAFSQGSGLLNVTMPGAASVAPPGDYMLFLVNGSGVPSVASLIQITRSAPPSVAVTSPVAGTVSGTAVTLAANASDPNGISSVQFTVDGALIGARLTVPPYTTSWDSTTVPNGPHSIGAVAINGTGVSGNATPVSITVSNALPAAPVVDAQVSVEGRGTQTTSPFGASAGDVLVAFATSDGPGNAAQTLSVSGAGLTWTLVKRVNARGGSTEIWTATASTALSNATVTSTQTRGGYNQSLTVMAFSNSRGIGTSATANGASGAPTVSVTTTMAGSLVYGAGNDYDNAIARTPGSGQAIFHEWLDTVTGDTYWVQGRITPSGSGTTVVTINDSAPTTDRWNLAAVVILPR